MFRAFPKIWFPAGGLLLIAFGLLQLGRATEPPANDASLASAVCPVVYQDDENPADRGYHYTFFGNAFFINNQGYLLTVAHVLETFRDGGQPYIIVNCKDAPPRILRVKIIATDPAHDVAILQVTPNPFDAKLNVTTLALSSDPATTGESVLAVSLHPANLRDAHSFELARQDFSSGQVLSFESTQLEKSAAPAEVFLLSHPVVRGQSGSPVISTDSHGVVGLIEGRWLRSSSASLAIQAASAKGQPAAVPGAAVPIRFAIALLRQHDIPFDSSIASAPPVTPAK